VDSIFFFLLPPPWVLRRKHTLPLGKGCSAREGERDCFARERDCFARERDCFARERDSSVGSKGKG